MMDYWCLRLELLKYEIVSLIIPNDLFFFNGHRYDMESPLSF